MTITTLSLTTRTVILVIVGILFALTFIAGPIINAFADSMLSVARDLIVQ